MLASVRTVEDQVTTLHLGSGILSSRLVLCSCVVRQLEASDVEGVKHETGAVKTSVSVITVLISDSTIPNADRRAIVVSATPGVTHS